MRRPTRGVRNLLLMIPLFGVLGWAGSQKVRGDQGVRDDQYAFNVAVSRAVPKDSTLIKLESVAGPAKRPAPADRLASALRRSVEDSPEAHPDGWREGDHWVYYEFPGGHRWWFQVRDGRLVNYDPAILAGQPQRSIVAIHSAIP